MKNIHLLPTDKPSRLYKVNNKLYFEEYPDKAVNAGNQHIYITSDEEIKEGDWMYYKHFGEDILTKYNTWGGLNTNVNEHNDYYKKIILTTDPDLIKDGVQSIDDEFLEWFVKNTICENIEVEKAEFKVDMGLGDSCIEYGNYYKIIIPKEEPKQETLEEAAKEFVLSHDFSKLTNPNHLANRCFQFGAEWNQEQILQFLYSEITERRPYSSSKMCEEVIKFIEQLNTKK